MGQRRRILTEILGCPGWKVEEAYFEIAAGQRVERFRGYALIGEARLVLRLARQWAPRTSCCGRARIKVHERLSLRRWDDLPWAGHPVALEYAPVRLHCSTCGEAAVEMLSFADRYQRQTRRLQQQVAIEAASMPVAHVAALHGLDWSTVRRAELAAIVRWQATRDRRELKHAGVDEKYLGRRGKRPEAFVTIVSDLETGEPVWIGWGRREETLARWLATLRPPEKAGLSLFAMDMHRPFLNAVRADPALAHVAPST